MADISTFHLLMVVLVYIVHRKHARCATNEVRLPDTMRDMLTKVLSSINGMGDALSIFRLSVIWPYVGALLCLYYVGGTHLERIARMCLMFALVRTVQIVLNHTQRVPTEYTMSLVSFTLLMSVYHQITPASQRHLIYICMCIHAIVVLLANPFHTTTSSLIDDVSLSHLIFYLMK